jgi:NAD(P)-dependent dehydrogenase (short-subunit alcohol dehydrogenase family)
MTAPLALVTGGVRRLGAVIAARFAKAGYRLALSSHADTSPDRLLADALSEHDTSWQHFGADLSDTDQAAVLIDRVKRHFGQAPDVLVNNAAIFGQDDWESMDAESLEAHFRLNLFTPLLLSTALVKAAGAMRPAIVHIVDQRIVNPNGDQLSYSLSKQALAASVRSMASAFGAMARVNAVAPGLVIPTDDYSADQMVQLQAAMPLAALPSPDSIAEAVLYLARAKDTTGQIIFADGGAHLRSYARDFMHL